MRNAKDTAIPDTPVSEGLDRQNLVRIQQRFLDLNAKRIEQMRSILNPQQTMCLDAIVLLLHTNHPMMPGFIDRETPCGVANFVQKPEHTKIGQKIAKSFNCNTPKDNNRAIEGLFVMGSVGSMAQSKTSDLDFWVCHRKDLTYNDKKRLAKKCHKISEWALTHKLEVHFFLMNAESFQSAPLSDLDEESSGSAQKILLLDEFYRTAIFLGGKQPLWWQVPPCAEAHYYQYAQTALHNRFVNNKHVLDFGGIVTIPAGEFIGAGIWQLYKAIDSPYKSVLKLLLLETYASKHPNITPLSLMFKKHMYAGETDIHHVDGYLIIYHAIEQYLLSCNQKKRLELVRRSFYFKVNIALSKDHNKKNKTWQGEQLANLVKQWGWSESDLQFLDNRKNWKAGDVATERSLLVNELNNSYHFIINFANHSQAQRAILPSEITILGRKLQATFEKKPGKIDWINPGISKNISEPTLHLSCEKNKENNHQLWTATSIDPPIYTEQEPSGYQTASALKTSSSVVETLLWCLYNRIIDDNTQLELELPSPITHYEIKKIINQLTQWLAQSKKICEHTAFKEKAHPQKVIILINAAANSTAEMQTDRYHRISNQSDPFCYSGFEINLINSADIVIQNSWHEINTRRFNGQNALVYILEEYLQLCIPGSQHTKPKLTIECVDKNLGSMITHRVRSWFDDIINHFYEENNNVNPRYIFKLGKTYYCLQRNQSRFNIDEFHHHDALIDHLSHSQKKPSTIIYDKHAFTNKILQAIFKQQQPLVIQVFYFKLDIGVEIFVLDENNSLFHQKIKGNHHSKPLAGLYKFLCLTLNRSISTHEITQRTTYPINFHEILKTDQVITCTQRTLTAEPPSQALFNVKAIAHEINKKVVFDYHCDGQEFSALSFNNQLELVVAQFIVSRRGNNTNYPIHINDLDLSLCSKKISDDGQLQTIHYLKIKTLLEKKLNHAMGIFAKN